jgi:hypothetical protein
MLIQYLGSTWEVLQVYLKLKVLLRSEPGHSVRALCDSANLRGVPLNFSGFRCSDTKAFVWSFLCRSFQFLYLDAEEL